MVAGMGVLGEQDGVSVSGAARRDCSMRCWHLQPEAEWDEKFEKVRTELASFAGVTALEQPAGFQGQLRDYQKEGLGWMEFLRRFSFGGCLC